MGNCFRKARYLIPGFFILFQVNLSGQDQRIADSLRKIYNEEDLPDTTKLELLRNLSFNEVRDLALALKYSEELITLSTRLGNNLYLHRGYFQKGNKKRLMGDLEEAIAAYFKSIEAAGKANFAKGTGMCYSAIADVYSISGNHKNSMLYYHKAISALQQTNDSIILGSAISNAGDEFLTNKMFDSALIYFKQASEIFDRIKYASGQAYSIGNIGMVYANLGQNQLAEKNIDKAIKMLEEQEDYYPICVYLISMSDIYRDKEDATSALNYAARSLRMAQQYGLKDQISQANQKLSELYEKEGNIAESFKYFKNYVAYRDSVNNIAAVQKMADLRTNYEVSQKQVEVDLLSVQKKNQRIVIWSTGLVLALIAILAIGLKRRNTFIKRTNKIIESERKRSDNLLLNILPEETAHELKQSGKVLAKRFESVTVLFTDFKGFTQYAENLSPEELVESVDYYFSRFDEIMEKHDLEKIKTVGDSYMCAAGLHFHAEGHAVKMVEAALEILQFVKESVNIKADKETRFEIRIGINTGPVVAGVVGTKKFAYDIWGDAVNVASRMESNSVPNRINISQNTYELVKDKFDCEYRGALEVKNRGSMKMYFVNGATGA
ncbi:MAG: tetratricopeptide repeat protein [Sphingobacteriales bacterium]|nr:tetratricopeptide repeat protein [Sphingobacteriales bacterium]